MTFKEWWDSSPKYDHLTNDPETEAARAAWNAALDEAAKETTNFRTALAILAHRSME